MYQHVLKLKGAVSRRKTEDMNRTWGQRPPEQNLAYLDVFRQFLGMLKVLDIKAGAVWPLAPEKKRGRKALVIICPTCNKDYKIPDEKIGKAGARARCKNCGEVMVIDPGGAVRAKRSEADTAGSAHATSPFGDAGTGVPLDHGVFMDYPELQGISPEKVAF